MLKFLDEHFQPFTYFYGFISEHKVLFDTVLIMSEIHIQAFTKYHEIWAEVENAQKSLLHHVTLKC